MKPRDPNEVIKIPNRIKFRRSNIRILEQLLFGGYYGPSSPLTIQEISDDSLAVSLFRQYFELEQGLLLSVDGEEAEFARRRGWGEPVRPVFFSSAEVTLQELKARAHRTLGNISRAVEALHPPVRDFSEDGYDVDSYSNGPYQALDIFSDDEIAELAAVSSFRSEISGEIKWFLGAALDRAAKRRG